MRTTTPNPTPKKRGRPPKKRPEAAQEEETTESPNRDRVPAEKALKCSICLDTSRCRKMKILPCKHKFHDRKNPALKSSRYVYPRQNPAVPFVTSGCNRYTVLGENMNCTQVLPLLVALSLLCTVLAWQQPESEYTDDSLQLMPGTAWKENSEKRNTWWTKKSIQNDEAGNCPVEKCMHVLFECLRRADSKTIYLHCKDLHVSCLASCLQKFKEKYLFNTVAMSS
ncbi:hypothetical protein JTE90_004296 [Oedothorax gibbosus]|uniref:Uncharacterized protein n=1 Tax=Oedothorax gibbosus TaxID=931172 RepID=A0AAV6VMV0_9ARAC|nr:hypothetical protein JTE90_004296 [Oedothorax gibbosus]